MSMVFDKSKKQRIFLNKMGSIGIKSMTFWIYKEKTQDRFHYVFDLRPAQNTYLFSTTSSGISKMYVNGNLVTTKSADASIPAGQWVFVGVELTEPFVGGATQKKSVVSA